MKATLSKGFLSGPSALGLLLLRLIAGTGLFLHGWQKVGSPGGMGGWMGDALPSFLQQIAALIEVVGGIGLVIGLLSPLVGLAVVAQMAAAYALAHGPRGDPFVGAPGSPSFELAALYLGIGFVVLLAGPGLYSLDYALWGRGRAVAEAPPEKLRKTA